MTEDHEMNANAGCAGGETRRPPEEPKAPYFYYRDHSHLPDPDPTKPVTIPGRIPTFPAKLFAILSRPDLADIISWMPHGRSWKVHKPREFEIKVIPSYFDHAKFSSFIRQANGWGFKRVTTKGTDRNSHYHELFLRGMPHLIKFMKRPVSGSKALMQPQHSKGKNCDPDFYKISEEHPLPELNSKTLMHPLDESSFLNSAKNNQFVSPQSFTSNSEHISQLQNYFNPKDKESADSTPSQAQPFLLPRVAQHAQAEQGGNINNSGYQSNMQNVPVPNAVPSNQGVHHETDIDPLTILLNDLSDEDTNIEDQMIQSLINDPSVPPPSVVREKRAQQPQPQSFPYRHQQDQHMAQIVTPAEEKPLFDFPMDVPEPAPLLSSHDEHLFDDPFEGGFGVQDFF